MNFILKNDIYLKKYVKEINDYKKINFNKDQLFLLNLYYNLINNRYNYFSSIKSFKEIIFIIKIIFNRKFMKQLV